MSVTNKVLDDPHSVAIKFADDFAQWINASQGTFNVALSGGSTPQRLFEYWASSDCPVVDWNRVHFFWGDERCVPPDDEDSNFGVANSLFFGPTGISKANIHRIHGEDDPKLERIRYSEEINTNVASENGLAQFDLVILGMGSDGHTASLFPDQLELMDSVETCGIAKHPDSGQLRITLTGKVIANAARIAFLITGESKAEKVAAILADDDLSKRWPATRLFNLPNTIVYLDKLASGN